MLVTYTNSKIYQKNIFHNIKTFMLLIHARSFVIMFKFMRMYIVIILILYIPGMM